MKNSRSDGTRVRKTLEDRICLAEGAQIAYRYYCSPRRRTLAITVHPDLTVLVRAPRGTGREEIRRFVGEHAEWIVRARGKFASKPRPEPPRFESGQAHHYAGKQYWLEVRQGARDCVTCLSDRLLVTIRHEPTEKKTKGLLDLWYRARAEILFHDRLAVCHHLAAREGIPIPQLKIRRMRSRWGSYSVTGGMTLNLLLIMMPVECLDYVILHELCHHRIGNHGAGFWNLLRQMMPDCRERKKQLNSFARSLGLP